LLLLSLDSVALEGVEVTAALETEGGDKTLNLGTGGIAVKFQINRKIKQTHALV
jgi:hypothetical protein